MALSDVRNLLVQAISAIDALQAPPPATTPIVRVAVGQSLQAAIDAATPGATILVQPGIYPGKLTLRKVPGSSATAGLTIQADVPTAPSPSPVRTLPGSPGLVTIQPAATDNTTIGCDKGAAFWTLIGLNILAANPSATIVTLGDGSETTLADQPHDITIDRCVLDGGWACKRGLALNGANLILTNSSIVGIMKPGQDSQCVGGWNGPGPFLIQNTLLDGGTETVLFGGSDPLIANLVPSDITIRGNTITKSLVPMQATKSTVKNALELKNAQRVLIEGNIIEHSWTDEQTGYLIQLTVRNQSGRAPWSTVRDVEIRCNVVRHGNQGINILGLDDIASVVGGPVNVSQRMQNVSIHDNLWYDLAATGYGGGSTHAVSVNNGPVNLQIVHNTCAGPVSVALGFTLGASKVPCAGLVVRDNIFPEGSYGIAADAASPGLTAWTPNVDAASVFDWNQMNKTQTVRKITYPGAHTTVGAVAFDAGYVASPLMLGSDGKPVGADLAAIHAAIPTLDLTK